MNSFCFLVRFQTMAMFGCAFLNLALAQDPEGGPRTADKQVVLETSSGTIVLEVFPEAAPRHVEAFLERVRSGFYVGTTFHRAIPYAIIQGGDPLTKDSANRERFGMGGLNELEAEFNEVQHVRGAVSAVLVPGDADSAGSQFFICVSDQVQLDGHYTAFGRVVEGLKVVEEISVQETDAEQRLLRRVEIQGTHERERPPPEVPPFADVPVADLAKYRAELYTTFGKIEISFYPEVAPEHVRQFLRFAELGMYDGTSFHRVVPGFVVQGGAFSSRKTPFDEKQAKYVKNLKPEFSDKKHVLGSVSMARGDDPDSAVDSFFFVLAPSEYLDGKYTVFGEVVTGLEVLDGIAQVPLRGETPLVPVIVDKVTVRK